MVCTRCCLLCSRLCLLCLGFLSRGGGSLLFLLLLSFRLLSFGGLSSLLLLFLFLSSTSCKTNIDVPSLLKLILELLGVCKMRDDE